MKNKPAASPAKHLPQRTCIACRRLAFKRELVRIVSTGVGEVEVDFTGKKSGRGAYLCQQKACWENALKSGKLAYSLHCEIKPENREKLVNYAKGFDNNKQTPDKIETGV